ncbi:HAT family dimerization protein, partial [Rhizoctonia solani AG-3 Rhs1AP]
MPDSTTVSRTTRHVYEKQGERVRTYFKKVETIHLAIDGWTSPTAMAYLGIVVHWNSEGRMWRAVLEMIRLEHKHTGEYLAQKTAECLWRYGIGGKAFTAYFMTVTARKRKSTSAKSKLPRKRRRGVKSTLDDDSTIREIALIESGGDPGEAESEDELEATSVSGEPDDIDAAKALHDEYVIMNTMVSALEYARTKLGLNIPETVHTAAQGIITTASKLAKKVHESPQLKHELNACIERVAHQLSTNRRSLARRVATRWNSDYDCLQSCIDLRICVEMLIEDSVNGLDTFRFSEYQWEMMEQLVRVLKIFKEATKMFSQSEVPLVHEVVPMFVRIRRKLERIRDDQSLGLEPIIRVAAHSSLLVIDKYMNMFEESEVYWIALVMCPNYKLQWLRDNGFSEGDIAAVRDLVTNRFNQTFVSDTGEAALPRMSEPEGESDDEWELGVFSGEETTRAFDSIEDYLQTEPVSSLTIKASGGPLKHWYSQIEPTARPRLAKFAMDYLTAPASSVDAERAFSCGRLTINHLQHQMSPDTFCAKMALRSWYGTPLLNGVEDVATLLDGSPEEVLHVD